MVLIISLVLLGILLLVVELLLLPGVTLAGIGACLAYAGAVFYAYNQYGPLVGSCTLAVVIILSIVAVVISLRSKTWKRFTLESKVTGQSNITPQQAHIKIGQCGVTITRLAPMGKVQIGDHIIEAKSMDSYIDPKQSVEVIGFDNTSVIVKLN